MILLNLNNKLNSGTVGDRYFEVEYKYFMYENNLPNPLREIERIKHLDEIKNSTTINIHELVTWSYSLNKNTLDPVICLISKKIIKDKKIRRVINKLLLKAIIEVQKIKDSEKKFKITKKFHNDDVIINI